MWKKKPGLHLPKYGTMYPSYSYLCTSWFWRITVTTVVHYGVGLSVCDFALVGSHKIRKRLHIFTCL